MDGESLIKLTVNLQKIWWRLEALLERWKRHMAHDMRIDTDYNPRDDDLRMLLKGIHRLLERGAGNYYYEGGDNNRVLSWILAVLAVGIISGDIVIYQQISSLKTVVAEWKIANEALQSRTR